MDVSGTRVFDLDKIHEEPVKFNPSVVSQSRQREELGARASAAEISPDRPLNFFLSDEQKMTTLVSSQHENVY